jgi:hypothetical protein
MDHSSMKMSANTQSGTVSDAASNTAGKLDLSNTGALAAPEHQGSHAKH